MLHKEKNLIILSTRHYTKSIVVRGNVIMERSVHNIICTSSYLLSLFSMNAITLSSLNLKTIRGLQVKLCLSCFLFAFL